VLCDSHNIDDEDEEKINEITKNCKINTFKLLEACNPKLIVGMGGRVAEAFNFIKKGTGGITNLRGKVYDWHDFKVFLTLHPHFVEEQKNYSNIFEQDFSAISEVVTGKKSSMQN
jgi:uracil-DNA glycosylase family 4